MTEITLTLTGALATAEVDGLLTCGMVGIPVHIKCDSAWDGLTKVLICKNGLLERSILGVGSNSTVAADVMAHSPKLFPPRLFLGVEGRNSDGSIVLPTVWADCGPISPAVDSSADPAVQPDSPAWTAVLEKIGDLSRLDTDEQGNLVDAINEVYSTGGTGTGTGPAGGYYKPTITQPDDDTMKVSFTPSKSSMPSVAETDITLPQGPTGDPGKDGGYYTPSVSQTGSATVEIAFSPSDGDMPEVEPVEITLPSSSGGSAGTGTPGKDGEDGADGGYYIPSVNQTGANTMEVSFMASNEEMPAVESVEITLPSGTGGSGGSVDADALAAALLTAIPQWEGGAY